MSLFPLMFNIKMYSFYVHKYRVCKCASAYVCASLKDMFVENDTCEVRWIYAKDI